MSVSIVSPLSGETVNTLEVAIEVLYSTDARFLTKPGEPAKDAAAPQTKDVVTWELTYTISGVAPYTTTVPAGDDLSHTHSFRVPRAGDYTVNAALVKKTTPSSGEPTTTPAGDDEETPIHVTNGGGVIIRSVASAPPIPASDDTAAAGRGSTPCPPCPPCPPPVVIKGTFPTDGDDPTTGLLIEIFRPTASGEVVEYMAIPQTLGSVLFGQSNGTVQAVNTFHAVFPPEARTQRRRYRVYMLGVLGRIILTTASRPVP